MKIVTNGLAEIHEFVSGLTLQSPLSDQNNNQIFASAYRYVHALLIWNEVLSTEKRRRPDADALLQFQELLSDLAAAQVLLLAGMYKPSRMMLRSSIENILRVVALEQGFLVAGAKFTYELITLVKSSRLGTVCSPVSGEITAIIDGYSKLCAFTHAASKPLLALRIPIISVAAFNQVEFNMISTDLKNLTSRYNRVVFALYNKQLNVAHHKHRDFVLDALSKKLKAHFSA